MSQPVQVFASFVPKDGQVESALQVLLTVRAATRQEPGCEQYDLFSAETDGRPSFHLIEKYTDADALQAHRDSYHYQAYRAAIPDLLDGPIGVVVLTEVP